MAQQTPWAILLCKWSDMPNEAKPRSFFEQMFTASGRGTLNMVDFFDDMSHGNTDIGGSQVFGWFSLPQQWSDYKGSGANPQGRQDLINWAKQAATANGVNLSSFFNVVICMNATSTQGTDLFGGGGGVVCDTNVLHGSILGQEMGHGYGLDHSRVNGSLADYEDRWDVMSTWGSCYMQPHNDYVLIGPGLNAANMAGRGWLDESRVWSSRDASFNEVIKLRPLHRRDLQGYLAARVGNYIVEFRTKARWDAAIPRSAVLIHRFEDNHSYLMSANNGQQDLVANSTFGESNPVNIFAPVTRVTVDEIDETNQIATIRLEYQAGAQVTSVGPALLFGGIAQGGDGFVFIGGKIIPIPPRSPLFQIIQQVAINEVANVLTSAPLQEALRRQVFSSIMGIAQQQLQSMETFSVPAPLPRVEKPGSSNKKRK